MRQPDSKHVPQKLGGTWTCGSCPSSTPGAITGLLGSGLRQRGCWFRLSSTIPGLTSDSGPLWTSLEGSEPGVAETYAFTWLSPHFPPLQGGQRQRTLDFSPSLCSGHLPGVRAQPSHLPLTLGPWAITSQTHGGPGLRDSAETPPHPHYFMGKETQAGGFLNPFFSPTNFQQPSPLWPQFAHLPRSGKQTPFSQPQDEDWDQLSL